MRLHAVYARFYRSLNYDFIRASSEGYEPDPWDATPMGDYPFVRIRLRPDITTVVGGNESGKTQVLRAIIGALTGAGYERSDFCRYSRFFGVDKSIVKPEFGAIFTDVEPGDVSVIEHMTGMASLGAVDRVALFRMNTTPQTRVYVRVGSRWSEPMHVKAPTSLKELGVPVPFEIDATVPLPDSVPISYLVDGKPVAGIGRDFLRSVWDTLTANRLWFASKEAVTGKAAEIAAAVQPVRDPSDDEVRAYDLAAKLLIEVAGLGRDLFAELQTAVRTKNGYATSIVDTINAELSKALDFPHWWSQDSRFELFVSLYEFDLVFMIRDRTGRTYGFDERSDGLKYFLSYFVQYLAHQPPSDGAREILLMDEPDRFLSSSGQQDLLRVFEDFAFPKDPDREPVQVVYVTHSPFLIDKNESDRIRVLEKGEHDEGTRVVTNASANHYEPLRSAFGSFVAETTFIGNCNIVVEGASDQVLLAGMSRVLGRRGATPRTRLDLNAITIVPAGGTRHIPYLVYLARGRDVEKPPVVVLLDQDKAGDEARGVLQAGGAYGKTLLDDRFVLQLGDDVLTGLVTDNPHGVVGIEDLVALDVAVSAAVAYCREFVPAVDVSALNLDQQTVFDAGSNAGAKGLLSALENAITRESAVDDFHLDKVAFARAVVDIVGSSATEQHPSIDAVDKTVNNFETLLAELGRRQREAERREKTEKISSRINRAKRDFTRTHSSAARKEDVYALMEEISSQLDGGPEAENVRIAMAAWEQKFGLAGDQREQVADFDGLLNAIRSLAYKAVRDVSRPEE